MSASRGGVQAFIGRQLVGSSPRNPESHEVRRSRIWRDTKLWMSIPASEATTGARPRLKRKSAFVPGSLSLREGNEQSSRHGHTRRSCVSRDLSGTAHRGVMSDECEHTQSLPTLLTLRDLCDLTQMSESTMYQLLSKGEGPVSVKIGRSLRFRARDIESWLEELANRPTRAHAGKEEAA